jgi:ADP-ribose pyrophosphatase YjhB (NUDIX family)
MNSNPNWLEMVRELQSVAQIGLEFCKNPYDTERYEQMRDLSARMAAGLSDGDPAAIKEMFAGQTGYATPKVDVRGAVFEDDRVLLVSEIIDGGRWTLPGGWADVNQTPAENVIREVREEAGLVVEAEKLAAVWDREKCGHPQPYPFHIYKFFFICRTVDVCAKKEGETGEARYFPVGDLPELSESRTLAWQIRRMYEHRRDPSLPTDYD